MKKKNIFQLVIGLIFVTILAVMYGILAQDSATHISDSAESEQSRYDSAESEQSRYDSAESEQSRYDGAESDTGYYSSIVPYVDYGTAPYRSEREFPSSEVTMPLHADRVILTDEDKERYLLQDYEIDFYFGSYMMKERLYTVTEIYPENRKTPFYYYEVDSYRGILDNGIIDTSTGVRINRLLNLVWIDYGHGSNDNYVRFFQTGSLDVSQIIHVPYIYDVYKDIYYENDADLFANITYIDGKKCLEIMDLFNDDFPDLVIERDFVDVFHLKFLNDEEIYIEYRLSDEGAPYGPMVKEIVNFINNETIYHTEILSQ